MPFAIQRRLFESWMRQARCPSVSLLAPFVTWLMGVNTGKAEGSAMPMTFQARYVVSWFSLCYSACFDMFLMCAVYICMSLSSYCVDGLVGSLKCSGGRQWPNRTAASIKGNANTHMLFIDSCNNA
jgi:hypothetical protein